MSAPPALMAQLPVFGFSDWLPAGLGLPMSAQVQGSGQTSGSPGAGGPPGRAVPVIVA